MDLNIPILSSLNQLLLALACLSLVQLCPSLFSIFCRCIFGVDRPTESCRSSYPELKKVLGQFDKRIGISLLLSIIFLLPSQPSIHVIILDTVTGIVLSCYNHIMLTPGHDIIMLTMLAQYHV